MLAAMFRAFTAVVVVYLAAGAVALAVATVIDAEHPIWVAAAVAVGAIWIEPRANEELAAAPSYAWVIVGPFAIALIFRLISLAMIERRMLERRPDFQEHLERTPMVIPWFPRKEVP